MARPKRLPDPTTSIQELLEQKAKHTEALNRINETLSRIGSMLGGNGSSAPRRGPGRPPASAPAAMRAEAPEGGRRRRRRKRGKFAMSGEDSIIRFVRDHRNPSTSEITAHWRSEGRGGKADNALSRLVKIRRLKRQAIPGERGSRYLVA
jgi:hypothetical protein